MTTFSRLFAFLFCLMLLTKYRLPINTPSHSAKQKYLLYGLSPTKNCPYMNIEYRGESKPISKAYANRDVITVSAFIAVRPLAVTYLFK